MCLLIFLQSCTETDVETVTKGPLPSPANLEVSAGEASAKISWSSVENAVCYHCLLYEGLSTDTAPIQDIAVEGNMASITGLTPGEDYYIELYAVPSESSGYTESSPASASFTTVFTDFVITMDGVEEDNGSKYAIISWKPTDKDMLYFPFVSQGETYDSATSEEEFINGYYESLRMLAAAYGLTFEQYIKQFLKTGDFTGSSIIPESGKYYAIAFGCKEDGTPTTPIYKLEILTNQE